MRIVHVFQAPERFVAGTVGMPGDRSFYLQAKDGPRLVSVLLEKAQVSVLAERIGELLAEVKRRGGTIPAGGYVEDSAPLSGPIEEEFRVGTMALAWDGDTSEVVVEAMAVVDNPEVEVEALSDDENAGPDTLRVRMTPGMAKAFARRAQRLVAAGRPPCYLCGQPLDSDGHRCPRLN